LKKQVFNTSVLNKIVIKGTVPYVQEGRMNIIALDSGTTNTRAYAVADGRIVGTGVQTVGSRDTAITGNTAALTQGVKKAIDAAMDQAGLEAPELEAVVASGMITSNMGLCEVPHVAAPAGKAELARHMHAAFLPEISSLPVYFIPGIKNYGDERSFDPGTFDMMRGEETETFGILARAQWQGRAVIVLPGSHSKIVTLNEDQRITGCLTTMSGELAWAMYKETILANSLPRQMSTSPNKEMAIKGAEFCARYGLTRACFAVRTMHLFGRTDEAARANFLIGAILYQDMLALRSMSTAADLGATVIIGGRKLYRELLAFLIQQYMPEKTRVLCLPDDIVDAASPSGAWELWSIRKEA
jgi:2-dehydro-3-deoxygalactonokinase